VRAMTGQLRRNRGKLVTGQNLLLAEEARKTARPCSDWPWRRDCFARFRTPSCQARPTALAMSHDTDRPVLGIPLLMLVFASLPRWRMR